MTHPAYPKDALPMHRKLTRWTAVAALAIAGALPLVSAHGQDRTSVASVDQLKTEAFRALRVGDFDHGNTLLARAASQSGDPALGQMHQWTQAFQVQLKKFADERHVAYDKAVADCRALLKAGQPDAALDLASRAQTLSDDKAGFHAQPWVVPLRADAVARGAKYEADGEWLKALRVYEDLAAIEPASVQWKEQLKTVTRRVRLLNNYAPDRYRKLAEAYVADREAVVAILAAATRPSTGPTTNNVVGTSTTGGLNRFYKQPTTGPVVGIPTTLPSVVGLPTTKPAIDAAMADAFKTDWHDTLKGIHLSQLTKAIDDIYNNYYRDVTYKGLLTGGLDGVQALLTTKGLGDTFPSLNDPAKRAAFADFLDGWHKAVAAATPANEQTLIDQFLSPDDHDGLFAANARTVNLPQAVLISEFADGAKSGLDPFTDVIWPNSLAEFRKAIDSEFSGVGIQIELKPDGDLTVVEPLPDSPAEAAGVQGEDVIARINGKPAKNVTTEQAVRLITGPTGTTVRLTLRSPDGKLRDVDLRRTRIKVASVKGYSEVGPGKWDYWVDPTHHIAYVRILSFTQTTTAELKSVLNGLGDRVDGLVLDLRGNPGGLLPAAIGVCDTFLKSGTIVSTHPDRDTASMPFAAKASDDHDEFTKPLVVLVNQYSASASEIVSGALKDDHRAILVGERTFGKGSVQQLFPLPPESDPSIIKLTTSHYYLPSGRCIHREENSTTWGVDPDVTVELTPEQMTAALLARRKMDVYHAATATPAGGGDAKLRAMAPAVTDAVHAAAPTTNPTTKPVIADQPTDLLQVDPQLSAAVLVLRLELAGARL